MGILRGHDVSRSDSVQLNGSRKVLAIDAVFYLRKSFLCFEDRLEAYCTWHDFVCFLTESAASRGQWPEFCSPCCIPCSKNSEGFT